MLARDTALQSCYIPGSQFLTYPTISPPPSPPPVQMPCSPCCHSHSVWTLHPALTAWKPNTNKWSILERDSHVRLHREISCWCRYSGCKGLHHNNAYPMVLPLILLSGSTASTEMNFSLYGKRNVTNASFERSELKVSVSFFVEAQLIGLPGKDW